MRVLIIDDEEEIREIVSFTFETEIPASFLYAESGNKAIDVIKKEDDIDIIICDFKMQDGTGGDVYKYIVENNVDIPYVLCSSSKKDEFEVFNQGAQFLGEITKPHIHEGIVEILKMYESLAKTNNKVLPTNKNKSSYSTISLDLLNLFDTTPSDVFVKINDHKFIKVIGKGDSVTPEEIQKYKDKRIRKLLIKKDKTKEYFDTLYGRINKILTDEPSDTPDKILDIHTVIMDTVRTLGLSSQIIRATQKSVEFAVNMFKKNKSFEDLSRQIFEHSTGYLTKHSIALAYVSTGILTKLPWDSPETRNKLVMASFLHDAAIKSPDFNEADVEQDDPQSLMTFESHPNETVKILKKFNALPPDVDSIILEHHEKPDGTGFPRKLTASQIKPLSSIFIFSHAIVDIVFSLEKKAIKPSRESVLAELNTDLYDASSFKKILEAFKKVKLFEGDE